MHYNTKKLESDDFMCQLEVYSLIEAIRWIASAHSDWKAEDIDALLNGVSYKLCRICISQPQSYALRFR